MVDVKRRLLADLGQLTILAPVARTHDHLGAQAARDVGH
jgi:hypothetical protein